MERKICRFRFISCFILEPNSSWVHTTISDTEKRELQIFATHPGISIHYYTLCTVCSVYGYGYGRFIYDGCVKKCEGINVTKARQLFKNPKKGQNDLKIDEL